MDLVRDILFTLKKHLDPEGYAPVTIGGADAQVPHVFRRYKGRQSLILERNQGSILRWYQGSIRFPKGTASNQGLGG